MSGKNGKVIKFKTQSKSFLETAQNTGESWITEESTPQNVSVQNDDILKQFLPELFEQKITTPNLHLQTPEGRDDIYSQMNITEPDVAGTPTTSPINVWNQNLDKMAVEYKDLPLYDDPKNKSTELKPRSQEEFQKYAKESIRKDIIGQVQRAGGLGADLSKSVLQEMVGNTATVSWMKMVGLDINQLPTNIEYDKEGNILCHGIKLNLDDNEKQVINDFNTERTTYHGENDSLLKQTAMLVGSLAIDYPLFALSGGIASGAISKIPFLAESAAANSVFGKLAGTFAVNDLMFNTINMPRMISIAKGEEQGNVLDEIWNNTKFAAGATIAGSLGVGVSKMAQSFFKGGESSIARLLDKYPGVSQELTAITSSFGLGTAFPSDVDRNGQINANDRIATGLSFAAMHFVNPNGFKNFTKEIQNRNVLMENKNVPLIKNLVAQGMTIEEAIKASGISDDSYYELKDNKLHSIDTDELVNNGKIIQKDGITPLDYNSTNSKNYTRINQIEPSLTRTLKDNIQISKINDLATDVYGRITKNLDPQYVIDNQNSLKHISWTIATSTEIGKVAEGFRKNRLPDDEKLNNRMISLANNWKLPYNDVRKFVVTNLPSYFANPEDFRLQLEENPFVVKDLDNMMKVASETIIKEAQQQYTKSIMDKLTIPYALLPEGKETNYNIDLLQAKRVLESEQQVKGTVQPSTKDVMFYDHPTLGMIPLETKKGKTTIYGTEIEVEDWKSKSKTAKQLKEEKIKSTETTSKELGIGSKISYELGGKSVKAEVTALNKEGKEIVVRNEDGTQLVISPNMVKGVEHGKEQVDIGKGKENYGGGGERQAGGAETGGGNRLLNVEGETPSGTVNESAQGLEKPSQIENNALEAQGKTNVEKPIQTIGEPNIEAPKRSKEEIFAQFKDDSLQKSVEQLVPLVEPNKANFRDATGKIRPEIIQRLSDIESKAEQSATKLSEATGTKISKEDVMITALYPHYTAKEIGSIFALRSINSPDAKRNTDFVNNRLKKLGLDIGTKAGQIGEIGKAEISQVGLESTTLKPSKEFNISETEHEIIQQVTDTQNKITDLLKERNLSGTTPERKTAIQSELGQLYTQKAELDKRYASLSSDENLYETRTERPAIPTTEEQKKEWSDEASKIGVPVEFGNIEQNPSEGYRAGLTYTKDGKVIMRFDKFADEETFKHENFHSTALLADKFTVDELLKNRGWNEDKPETWASAHEKLYEDYTKWQDKKIQDESGFFSKLKAKAEQLYNYFFDRGAYREAKFFRDMADGKLKLRPNVNIESADLKEARTDFIRTKAKSLEGILDSETVRIDDNFYRRLKNNGVKDTEINYLKSFLKNGEQLKGDELKRRVVEKLFPMQIKPVPESVPNYYDEDYIHDMVVDLNNVKNDTVDWKEISNKYGFDSDTKDYLIEGLEMHIEDAVAEQKNFLQGGTKSSQEFSNMTTSGITKIGGEFQGKESMPNAQATNYRILSFDIPGQEVKQVHDYWGNRKESVGWARVEDEVVDGKKTGYLNVNEIQGQTQYTNIPKRENLKVGDRIKVEGENLIYQGISEKNGHLKFERNDGDTTQLIQWREERYDDIVSKGMGSQPEFLESLKPIFHELQIKSLIQYAADNGYEGVRFPTAESISKIEGFGNLEGQLKSSKEAVNEMQMNKLREGKQLDELVRQMSGIGIDRKGLVEDIELVKNRIRRISSNIQSEQQHIKDMENALNNNVRPVQKFYEESVGLSGRKLRKENWYKTKDTYGNEWFETKVKPEDTKAFNLYETRKPEEIAIEEHERELAELSPQLERYFQSRAMYNAPSTFVDKVRNNIITRKLTNVKDTLYKAALQNRNVAEQVDHNGIHKNPITNHQYHILEKMVLQMHENINRINENTEGWNKGTNFLELSTKETFPSKYGEYATAISDLKREPIKPQDIESGETLDQFIERAGNVLGYTPEEKAMEKRLQVHARLNQQQIREGHRQFLKDNAISDGEMILANSLSSNELKKYFGDKIDYTKSEQEQYKVANDLLNRDSALVDKIVDDTINKLHPEYYGLYRNESRPADPSYYSFTGERPLDKDNNITTDQSKIVRYEKLNGYGKNEKEAREWADKFDADGFAITSFEKIGELIRKEQFDRLTANQLMNLVDLGRIEASNPLIRSLLNAIKTGNYEQHTINKKFIKGMHYTPEELERGIYALTNESVSASTKRYGLATARAELGKARADVNRMQQNPIIHQFEKDKFKRDLDYATQIYNQVSRSDQSFIDPFRKAATAWYIGVKPSFWFQQMMQPLQITLPEAVSQAKNTTLDGKKVWTEGFSKAFKLAQYLQAEKKGELLDLGLDKDFIDLYHQLDSESLMGAVGMEELAGKGRDLEMRYGSDIYKGWNSLLKVANLGGSIAEKFTRMQSLATFYDIGKAKGLEGTALKDYLVKNVKNTMSGWGALDRPAVFQSKQLGGSEQKILKAIDKAFFTFKTYTNANLGQYDRLFRNKQWGALGTKAIVGVGMHGLAGFPFAATLFAIGNLFSDDDTEYEALKLLDELDSKMGGKFGSILGKGALSQFGVDMQNMFDERTAYATDVFSETRSKSAEGKLLEAMLGAPYGLTKDFIDAGDATVKLVKNQIINDVTLDADEKQRAIRNMFKFSPLFFRNILTAMSLGQDGVQLKGKEILKSDDISWADIVYKVMGFSPTKIADAYEYQFSGTPAKLSRTSGKIKELKQIRTEITKSKDYNADERRSELTKIAKMMREYQKQEAELTKQSNIEKRQRR